VLEGALLNVIVSTGGFRPKAAGRAVLIFLSDQRVFQQLSAVLGPHPQ